MPACRPMGVTGRHNVPNEMCIQTRPYNPAPGVSGAAAPDFQTAGAGLPPRGQGPSVPTARLPRPEIAQRFQREPQNPEGVAPEGGAAALPSGLNPQDRLCRAEDRDQVSLPCGFSARKIPQDFQENPFPVLRGRPRRGKGSPSDQSNFYISRYGQDAARYGIIHFVALCANDPSARSAESLTAC